MSTKIHDNLIKDAVRWAETLGYEVIEQHLATDTGADAIFQNQFQEEVILEVVTEGRFKNLFEKDRIGGRLKEDQNYFPTQLLGVIVVGDRTHNIEKHAIEAGLSEELFYPPDQKFFQY